MKSEVSVVSMDFLAEQIQVGLSGHLLELCWYVTSLLQFSYILKHELRCSIRKSPVCAFRARLRSHRAIAILSSTWPRTTLPPTDFRRSDTLLCTRRF